MARIISIIFFSFLLAYSANAKLRSNFYATTCPRLHTIVFNVMRNSVRQEPRLGASILRLFFHDCFVNGCDGSILLDDTPTFTGEKNSRANKNSARGFEVIDRIKTEVEAACKATVSCADILALAARDGTTLLGGPRWVVKLGRRDSRTASQSDADSDLPSPFDDLSSLVISFLNKGLSARDMVALSGSHTIGLAHCRSFRSHIYNDTNIDPRFAALRHSTCPRDPNAGGSNLAPLDSLTPTRFGSHYYKNLVHRRGLLHSDQELFNGGSLDELVRIYSINHRIFFLDFAAAMVRMGNLSPLTGTNGEIRRNCRVIN